MMTRKTLAGFRMLFRLIRDDRGVTATLVALTISVLFAFTGLAVDAGWWYTVRRQNQSGADSAALSAAYEVVGNPTTWTAGLLTTAASQAATRNGYSGVTPAVTYPYNGDASLLQVVLQQNQSTWFASLTGLSNVTIADRAVAKVVKLSPACTYVLNPTAPEALSITGSATLAAPNCSICVASNADDSVYMQGANNAVLTADTILTAGQISMTGQPQFTLQYPAQVGAPQPQCADPYASTLTHSFLTSGMPTVACGAPTPTIVNGATWYVHPGNCVITNGANRNNATLNESNINLSPNTVLLAGTGQGSCCAFNIKNQTVNLSPGTYWFVNGDLNLLSNAILECTACVPGGAGVTIILTTNGSPALVGNVTQQSNALVSSLNAPGSGTYQNLLLIQDSNGLPAGTNYTDNCPPSSPSSSCTTFIGGPNQTLDGLVYFANTDLTFQGNPTTGNTSCLLTVANTLHLAGNTTTFATTGCPSGGIGGVKSIYTVALVE